MGVALSMRQLQQMGAPANDSASLLHQLRAVSSCDADEHAKNLTGWEQRYDQVAAGAFHGSLVERRMDELQVFCERTSHAVRQSCCVWPDAFWFGLPKEEHSETRINGRVAAPNSVLVRPGSREFELMTPSDYAIYGIVIRQSRLRKVAEQLRCEIDWKPLAENELHRVDPVAHGKLMQLLPQVLATGKANQAAASRRVQEGAIISLLLNLLDTSNVDEDVSRSLNRRRQVVAAARDYVLSRKQEVVMMPDLCARLGVSRRTLQTCFDDVLGISPAQYLRVVRLNEVRRRLTQSNHKRIADVAAEWGFSHMSQFAVDYRKLFGESPSETLQRAWGTPDRAR